MTCVGPQILEDPMSYVPVTSVITTLGFTGHEMLDAVGLIHMNGRIYDPRLGRFLQADPFVQYVDDTQSFNRYSYVLNNPLAYTDPSGYLSFKQALSIVVTVVVAIYCEPCAAGFWEAVATGAALGGFNAVLFGGNVAQGIALGAFTAAATYGIAQAFEGPDIATTSRETADVVSEATSTHMAGDPVTADVVNAGSSGGSLEQAGINTYPTGQVPEGYTGRTAWVDNSVAPNIRFEPLAGGVRSGGIPEWNMIVTAKTGLSPFAQAAVDAAAVVSAAFPALRAAKTVGQISRGKTAVSGVSAKNPSGTLDNSARLARTQPYPRQVTKHANQRLKTRDSLVTNEALEASIVRGQRSFNPSTGKTAHNLPASQSPTGRGVTSVTNHKGDVVTVIDKGSRFEP